MAFEPVLLAFGALALFVLIWAGMRGLFALIDGIYYLLFRWS